MNNLHIPDSGRLTFQLMDESHAEDLWQLDQDTEVMRYINGGKISSREDIHEILLPRLFKYRDPEKGWGIWKVILRSDATYLGWILVRPMNFFSGEREDNNLELGWRFFRQHWGSGYGTEATKAIMQALYEQRGITHFSAIADTENVASIHIMKKVGMKFLKTDIVKDPLINAEVDFYTITDYCQKIND